LTVVRTVQRFIETDSAKDRSRSGPTSASNDEKVQLFCKN